VVRGTAYPFLSPLQPLLSVVRGSAFPCLKGRLTVSGGSAHATGGKPLPELNTAPATPSIPLKMGMKSRAEGRRRGKGGRGDG
jgi:hypothetical protein